MERDERRITVRRVDGTEDLAVLTAMIHAAYAPHAASGLRFWGTHQSAEETGRRLAAGTAWVAELGPGDYVGTATLRPPQPNSPVALFRRPDVFTLSQFCVSPDWKGRGVGRMLHEQVLRAARECGAGGVALDTAQPALALVALYEAWGYRVVGECDWRPRTNYPSFVMFKELAACSP